MYKVFIVDDEGLISKGLEKIIDWERLGCNAFSYTSSTFAYESAIAEKPQILITDIKMPFMDGLELISKLKSSAFHFEAIILSGYSEFEYARKGIELGVNKYILKPVNQDELISAVMMSITRYEEKSGRTAHVSIQENGAPVKDMPCQNNEEDDIIESVKKYITTHYTENISLAALSERFYLNPVYLSQLFKKKTGDTYINFLINLRMEKAKELLSRKNIKISEVCQLVGYDNVQHFSRTFERIVGLKPSVYRKE